MNAGVGNGCGAGSPHSPRHNSQALSLSSAELHRMEKGIQPSYTSPSTKAMPPVGAQSPLTGLYRQLSVSLPPTSSGSSSSCACIDVWSGRRGPTLHVSPGTEAAPLVGGGGSHSHKAEHRVCATAGGGVTFHSRMQGALGSRRLVL